MGESYTSLVLGIVAVIIVTVLVIVFVRQNNKSELEDEAAQVVEENVHTVADGETLWSISEEEYGSGYNWVDVAQENNIENSDAIETGDVLTLPDVEPKTLTVVQDATEGEPEATREEEDDAVTVEEDSEKVTGDTYVVKHGDHLWGIAVRAYGDGYKWVEIARANNLDNPDVIHAGNKLTLPRN